MSATILVVDDDVLIRGFLCELLEQEGYAVAAAGDGVDALAVLERQPVDLIVSDVVMPRMGGIALRESLRESLRTSKRSTPLILMSAMAKPRLFDDVVFVRKPFDMELLLETVVDCLGGALRKD